MEAKQIPSLPVIVSVVVLLSLINLVLAVAVHRGYLENLLFSPRFYVADTLLAIGLILWTSEAIPQRTLFLPGRDVFALYLNGTLAIDIAIVRRKVAWKALLATVGGACLWLIAVYLNGHDLDSINWNIFLLRLGWLVSIVGLARYFVWVFAEGSRAGVALLSSVQDSALLTPTFRREGVRWTVAFNGKTCQFGDSVGFSHLHTLLASPGQQIASVTLTRGDSLDSNHIAIQPGMTVEGFVPLELSDSGPLLDLRAKHAYRRQIALLEEKALEAGQCGDSATVNRANQEIGVLRQQLSSCEDRFGRDRRAGDSQDRARSSVSKALKRATELLADWNPDLGEHLDRSIKKGKYCSYAPDVPVDWHL
jgi:hypothetical protein